MIRRSPPSRDASRLRRPLNMRKTILLAALSLSALYGHLGCVGADDSDSLDETSHDTKEAVNGYRAGAGGSAAGGESAISGGACSYPQWKSGTQYHTGDIVLYNGSAYVATHDNPGYIPTVSTWFWSPSPVCSGGSGSTSTSGAGGAGGATGGGSACNYPQWKQGTQY